MKPNIAISASNIVKTYRLGLINRGTFQEEALRVMAKLFGKRTAPIPGETEPRGYFKALDNVSFEIPKGEVTGFIGGNGAGKSTMLKILARITEPTSGRAMIRGRIGSLLEVGAGFHPEFTGRQNVFMNGMILGMKQREIASKFDEITAFSGVGEFIDTPVKHYSSGMYVRLAFSVASHLEAEVLFIDEVLAVGDVEFRAKCYRKMEELVRSGRTIVFVSHDTESLKRLCHKCYWFEKGAIKKSGPAKEILAEYIERSTGSSSVV